MICLRNGDHETLPVTKKNNLRRDVVMTTPAPAQFAGSQLAARSTVNGTNAVDRNGDLGPTLYRGGVIKHLVPHNNKRNTRHRKIPPYDRILQTETVQDGFFLPEVKSVQLRNAIYAEVW